MVKVVVALVLLGHSLGHSMGILQVAKVAVVNPGWHGDSWLLSGPLGASATQLVGIVLWAASIVGFAVLAGVVIGWLPAAWWQPVAIGSAVVSLIGLALFPMAFPTFSTIGAVAIDVAVLVAVIWLHWTPGNLPA